MENEIKKIVAAIMKQPKNERQEKIDTVLAGMKKSPVSHLFKAELNLQQAIEEN